MNLKLRWSTKELENYLKSDLCFLFKCGLVLNYLFYFGTQKSQWSTLSLQYTIVEKYWSHYHFVSLIIIVFLHFVILYWIRCFWKVKYTGLKSKPIRYWDNYECTLKYPSTNQITWYIITTWVEMFLLGVTFILFNSLQLQH